MSQHHWATSWTGPWTDSVTPSSWSKLTIWSDAWLDGRGKNYTRVCVCVLCVYIFLCVCIYIFCVYILCVCVHSFFLVPSIHHEHTDSAHWLAVPLSARSCNFIRSHALYLFMHLMYITRLLLKGSLPHPPQTKKRKEKENNQKTIVSELVCNILHNRF